MLKNIRCNKNNLLLFIIFSHSGNLIIDYRNGVFIYVKI